MLIWSGFFAGIAAGIGLNSFLNALSQRKREARVREAERRAADAERLAELGSLTSGLAHEIKNPLSSVVLNAQLVEEAPLEELVCEICPSCPDGEDGDWARGLAEGHVPRHPRRIIPRIGADWPVCVAGRQTGRPGLPRSVGTSAAGRFQKSPATGIQVGPHTPP